MEKKTCTKCKAIFECGAKDTVMSCWCYELPRVVSPKDTTDCLCPVCLAERVKEIMKQQESEEL